MLTKLTEDIQNWDLNKVGKTRLIEMLLQPTYNFDHLAQESRYDFLKHCDMRNQLEYLKTNEIIKWVTLNKITREHKRNSKEKTCEIYEYFPGNIQFSYTVECKDMETHMKHI